MSHYIYNKTDTSTGAFYLRNFIFHIQGKYSVFVFLGPAYLTQHYVFKIQSPWWNYEISLFYSWLILYCIYVLHIFIHSCTWWYPSDVCIKFVLSIHPFNGTHFCWFHILYIFSSVLINKVVQRSDRSCFCLLSTYLVVESLDYMNI